MEEAYEEAPKYQGKLYKGGYANIPENYPHVYYSFRVSPNHPVEGIDDPKTSNPAMNVLILDRMDSVMGNSFTLDDYLMVEDDEENLLLVMITDELLQANL